MPNGLGDCLREAGGFQLATSVAQMEVHGTLAYCEPLGDFGCIQSFAQPSQTVAFACADFMGDKCCRFVQLAYVLVRVVCGEAGQTGDVQAVGITMLGTIVKAQGAFTCWVVDDDVSA